MKENDKIELRSEEMQDILTRPPHILIRSGISVICAVILTLLIGSFFFKYPDKVVGEIVITTENPPVWLIAQTNGKIKELNCTDKSQVSKGQVLAVIENPAQTNDVRQMKEQLALCRIVDSDTVFYIPAELLTKNYETTFAIRQLGTIQNAYSAFLRTVTDYENFLSFNTTEKEKEALLLQIKGHTRYSQTLQRQLKLKQEEMQLAKTAYERETQLFERGVISKSEMETAENAYLNIRQSYQQLEAGRVSDQIESAQLVENLSKLDTQQLKEKNSLFSALKTAQNELNTAIENWEQTYLLTAPEDGTVTFNSFWTKNQFVSAGNKVLAIVPNNPGKIIGRIQTPAQGSGKVKIHQRVNIKVQGYPYMEYGALQGKVSNVSLLSNEKNYSVEVELPQGLTTGTGKKLDFTGELGGEAEIITDDRSLLARILAPLAYLLKNHWGESES
ncbi:hemolysin [Bacteroidia bacterium]|nr:hemolysin [Bacteroidia bacterium]